VPSPGKRETGAKPAKPVAESDFVDPLHFTVREDMATKKRSQNMLATRASDIFGPLWSEI